MTDRRWLYALLAICALGLGIRVGYVLGWRDIDTVGGDAYYYHRGANLLADGKGFVHPYLYDQGITAPGADHPPGYILVLAVPSLFGLDGLRAHQITSCLIGAGTVALVGLLARRVAGPRAGLLAAGFAAIYPNLWFNDAAIMSETLALFLAVAVSLAAYWTWDDPASVRRWATLGASIGLASLARAEAALLIVLLLVPLAVWAPRMAGWRTRGARAGLATAAALLVMAPWVVANLIRFEHPSTLSTQMGPTLEVGNCDLTYHGDLLGAWSPACASEIQDPDRSVLDQVTRDKAFTYMGHHRSRLPAVIAARLGRTWGLYAPDSQLQFDVWAEARPIEAARVGLGMYYLLAVGSVLGLVALRRRGVPSFPLTVWLINVAITVVVFYGSTRFRAPAEPFLVVLAAAGVEWLLVRRHHEAEVADVVDEAPVESVSTLSM
jgi:4-amino-4-deoxy-L-arabinose transferase-like glycosyltransferase